MGNTRRTDNQDLGNYYVTVTEAAEWLSCTVRHLRRLCDEGKVEGAVKKARLWDIPVSSVRKLQIQQRRRALEGGIAIRLLRPYVELHLVQITKTMRETGDKILALETQVVMDDWGKAEITKLKEEFHGQSRYLHQILRDLRTVDR